MHACRLKISSSLLPDLYEALKDFDTYLKRTHNIDFSGNLGQHDSIEGLFKEIGWIPIFDKDLNIIDVHGANQKISHCFHFFKFLSRFSSYGVELVYFTLDKKEVYHCIFSDGETLVWRSRCNWVPS